MTIQRVDFATTDPCEARDFIDHLYGARLRLPGRVGDTWRVSLALSVGQDFHCDDVRTPADLSFDVTGRDEYIVTTILTTSAEFERGPDGEHHQAGDVFVAVAPDSEFSCRSLVTRSQAVGLAARFVADVASGDPSASGAPWRLLDTNPVVGGARRWRETVRYATGVLAEPELAASPLIAASIARLLAATFVTVFPNNSVPTPTSLDRNDAHTATLRRAMSFIEANPDLDISVTDIAQAAFVTSRAVQVAFRRHLDTTPMAYLRRVRLDRAHVDLVQARPGDGATVSAIAARWGFSSLGRFARQYRETYGVTPSESLHV
ncbi:MAG TPA: helix-turn-helix transcriptional regulator [Jatrophihabitans sp.]